MQRQDGNNITTSDMLLFIWQLLSLSSLSIRLVAENRILDDRLILHFRLTENSMLVVLAGILNNVNTSRALPGIDEFDLPDPSIDRQAELLRIAMSFRQIAMALAVLLAANPRAFRDGSRRQFPSLRGGAAEPAIQRWESGCFAPRPMKPVSRRARHCG
jgi:hypothetical protein